MASGKSAWCPLHQFASKVCSSSVATSSLTVAEAALLPLLCHDYRWSIVDSRPSITLGVLSKDAHYQQINVPWHIYGTSRQQRLNISSNENSKSTKITWATRAATMMTTCSNQRPERHLRTNWLQKLKNTSKNKESCNNPTNTNKMSQLKST